MKRRTGEISVTPSGIPNFIRPVKMNFGYRHPCLPALHRTHQTLYGIRNQHDIVVGQQHPIAAVPQCGFNADIVSFGYSVILFILDHDGFEPGGGTKFPRDGKRIVRGFIIDDIQDKIGVSLRPQRLEKLGQYAGAVVQNSHYANSGSHRSAYL